MRRARALGAAIAALSALAGCDRAPAGPAPLPERPAILLVIGDDVGFGDYGFMGSPIARTPNLDRLAAQGVVFTHAFDTASVCRPSLQSLLPGLPPLAVSRQLARAARGPEPRRFADTFETLPEILVRRGYRAFAGGKFWEGSPLDAGFTDALLDWPPWHERGPLDPLTLAAGGYALALGRETLAPLEAFLDAAGHEPFFVWYAPMLPHRPFDAPERYVELFRDAELPELARAYFANLARFDESVGEVLAMLEQRGLRERTLVVYLSDNGWDALHDTGDPSAQALGGPGGKLSIHELGFRTPLVFSWPGVIPGGRRDGRLVSSLDLFPTLLELAGAPPPASPFGRSLVPALLGREGHWRDHLVGNASGLREDGAEAPESAWFLRTPEWRFVSGGRDRPERLYRIEEDPGEGHDLAAQNPDVVRDLRLQLLRDVAALEAASRPGRAPARPAPAPAQPAR